MSIRTRLKELAAQYPRYGYLMLHGLLKGEGLVVNRKHTYRLYTEEALQVRTKKAEKAEQATTADGSSNRNESALVYGLCIRPA